MRLTTNSFLPFSAYKIIETKHNYKAYLRGGKVAYIPKHITITADLMWLIGVWSGDNFGVRGGSKPTKIGIKTSGRFGVINNDLSIIRKVIKVMQDIGLRNIKIGISLPKNTKIDLTNFKKEFKRFEVKSYNGSDWRREIGFAVYVNNTSVLRVFEKFFNNLTEINDNLDSLLAGIIDSEGNIDKANKMVQITNKDKYIQKIVEHCLHKLSIKYKVRIDKRERILTLIRDIKRLSEKISLVSQKKQNLLLEMISGNFAREVDLIYMKKFLPDLKNGTNVNKLYDKYNTPKPTVKLILRNLYSAGLLKRIKKDHAYFYSLDSAELSSKPSAKRDN